MLCLLGEVSPSASLPSSMGVNGVGLAASSSTQNASEAAFRWRRVKCRRVRKKTSPARRIAPEIPPTTPPASAPTLEWELVEAVVGIKSDEMALFEADEFPDELEPVMNVAVG